MKFYWYFLLLAFFVIYVNAITTCIARSRSVQNISESDVINDNTTTSYKDNGIQSVYWANSTTNMDVVDRLGVFIPLKCIDGSTLKYIRSIDRIEAIIDVDLPDNAASIDLLTKPDLGLDMYIYQYYTMPPTKLAMTKITSTACDFYNITTGELIEKIKPPSAKMIRMLCNTSYLIYYTPTLRGLPINSAAPLIFVLTAKFSKATNAPPNSDGFIIRKMHPNTTSHFTDTIWRDIKPANIWQLLPDTLMAISLTITGEPIPPPPVPISPPIVIVTPPPPQLPVPVAIPVDPPLPIPVDMPSPPIAIPIPVEMPSEPIQVPISDIPVPSPQSSIPEGENPIPLDNPSTNNPIDNSPVPSNIPTPTPYYVNDTQPPNTTVTVTTTATMDNPGSLFDNLSEETKTAVISVFVIAILLAATFIVIVVLIVKRRIHLKNVQQWKKDQVPNAAYVIDGITASTTNVGETIKYNDDGTQVVLDQKQFDNDKESNTSDGITNRKKSNKPKYSATVVNTRASDKSRNHTIPKFNPTSNSKYSPTDIELMTMKTNEITEEDEDAGDEEKDISKKYVDDSSSDGTEEEENNGDSKSNQDIPLLNKNGNNSDVEDSDNETKKPPEYSYKDTGKDIKYATLDQISNTEDIIEETENENKNKDV